MRTLSVPVVAYDETLADLAASFDAAVEAACADLEARGFRIASIAPITTSVSQDVGDASKSHWTTESGMIAVISYREASKE